MNQNPSLSIRGNLLASNPARVDFELYLEAVQNLYCPENNPNGAFPLNVAENHLMASIIKEQLELITNKSKLPEWVLSYTHSLGHPEVREKVARFMGDFLCNCNIPADSLGFSSGAAGVIEVSSFILANPGDLAVIPAPSYPMYTHDLGLKSGVVRYNLQTHFNIGEIGDGKGSLSIELLNKAWEKLKGEGKSFKILLITSPDNPTGCRYTEHELENFANWCIEHEIHLIVNEIYGLSLLNILDEDLKHEYNAGRANAL